MRKLIVAGIVSLDGHFDGPEGDFMAMPLDLHFDTFLLDEMRNADVMLLGKGTYVGFRSFWPAVQADPEATSEERQVSTLHDSIDKVVVSDTLEPDPRAAWHDITRIVRRAEAHDAVRALKAEDGGDIIVFGSRALWHDLIAARLVDELHLMLGAGITGGGTPAFAGLPATPLRLTGTQTWADGSNIVLKYAIER
jgi:dihydrofolate reductase